MHMDGWMRTHPGRAMTIYDIPRIASEAWMTASTPRNIQSGFRVTGISPFNPDIHIYRRGLRAQQRY